MRRHCPATSTTSARSSGRELRAPPAGGRRRDRWPPGCHRDSSRHRGQSGLGARSWPRQFNSPTGPPKSQLAVARAVGLAPCFPVDSHCDNPVEALRLPLPSSVPAHSAMTLMTIVATATTSGAKSGSNPACHGIAPTSSHGRQDGIRYGNLKRPEGLGMNVRRLAGVLLSAVTMLLVGAFPTSAAVARQLGRRIRHRRRRRLVGLLVRHRLHSRVMVADRQGRRAPQCRDQAQLRIRLRLRRRRRCVAVERGRCTGIRCVGNGAGRQPPCGSRVSG